jgi:hypothetical protein
MKAACIITTHPLVSARQQLISRNSYGKQQPKWAAPLRVVTIRYFPISAMIAAPKVWFLVCEYAPTGIVVGNNNEYFKENVQ